MEENKQSQPTHPIEELINQRLKKVEQMLSYNVSPYPTGTWKPNSSSSAIILNHSGISHGEEKKDALVKIAGRITLRRVMGKASFFDITDSSGRIQVYIKQNIVGDGKYKFFSELIDIGDIIGVEGYVFRTKTGELTVSAQDIVLLSKSLRPLPEKWHGLKDPEVRYRQRYLDLISNPKVMETFKKRIKIIENVRETLGKKGFLEVETPMMQSIAGGALAKPFVTHHNALDTNLYLRIAPELFLKRLLIGGFEKVFEIGKSFRNEGIDRRHNPEFTMVEIYQAYADYRDMMDLCEDITRTAALCVNPALGFEFEGKAFNLSRPFKKISLFESLREKTGCNFEDVLKNGNLPDEAKKLGVDVSEKTPHHKILDEVFDNYVQPELVEPTFIYDYPAQFSPLAQVKSDNPFFAERFELFIASEEIANAYSELNNPLLQKEKFVVQQKMKEEGIDDEAASYDSDYITALEHGMPPAGGLGIGLDRLVMILSGAPSIREVILFPTLRVE